MIEQRKIDNDTIEITTTKTFTQIIDLKQIQSEINSIQKEIDNKPKLKTKEDKETLDFWNSYNDYSVELSRLEAQKTLLQNQLNSYKLVR